MTDASAQLAKLTPKQRRFADAYLGEAKGNATEAARIAGYKLPEQSGYENKKKPEIRAYIDDRLNAETLSSAEVLKQLTDVGAARWREFVEILQYDDKGEPLRVKMDLSAKIKALELLGKHHQLFSDNLNLNGSIEVREFVGIPDEAP